MNANVRVGEQYVWFDHAATRELYATDLIRAGADECGCAYCKNFAAQREALYPAQFTELLIQVGIDPHKELEAFDYDFGLAKQTALYGGWFVFVGGILEGKEWRPASGEERFSYWFTDSFPKGGLSAAEKLVAVEFMAEVPWVCCDSGDSHIRR